MTYEIQKARRDHVLSLADRLRGIDREEIWAAVRMSPLEGLAASFEASAKAWTGIVRGVPEIMFGVAKTPGHPAVGRPWLLASDEVMRLHRRDFVRESRLRLPEMGESFYTLENHVLVTNRAAIRWLKWLGFEVDFRRVLVTWNSKMMVPFKMDLFPGRVVCA